jgi:hypothetical protein
MDAKQESQEDLSQDESLLKDFPRNNESTNVFKSKPMPHPFGKPDYCSPCKKKYDDDDILCVTGLSSDRLLNNPNYPFRGMVPPSTHVKVVTLKTKQQIYIYGQHDVSESHDKQFLTIWGNLSCPVCEYLFASVLYSFNVNKYVEVN